MSVLGWKDAVRLRGRNGQRARNSGEFGFVNEGWVSDEADIDAVLVVSDDVLFSLIVFVCVY